MLEDCEKIVKAKSFREENLHIHSKYRDISLGTIALPSLRTMKVEKHAVSLIQPRSLVRKLKPLLIKNRKGPKKSGKAYVFAP